jgi:hypothetical protein
MQRPRFVLVPLQRTQTKVHTSSLSHHFRERNVLTDQTMLLIIHEKRMREGGGHLLLSLYDTPGPQHLIYFKATLQQREASAGVSRADQFLSPNFPSFALNPYLEHELVVHWWSLFWVGGLILFRKHGQPQTHYKYDSIYVSLS